MVSNENITSITVKVLKDSFFNYYSKAQEETKHLVLDRLFYNERRTTSYMTGLQTSLGMGFWEKLAKEFARLNNFTILDNSTLLKPDNIPDNLKTLIHTTKETREENNGATLNDFRNSLNTLFPSAYTGNNSFSPMIGGRGSDLILNKGANIYIYDIKTVQVNSGSGNSFNDTIIQWIAFYKYKYGLNANNIFAKLAFPYNAKNERDDAGWWNDFGSRVKPMTRAEVDVGNEFWSFLTDNPNALTSIIEGIDIVASNNQFIALFQEVFTCTTNEDLKRFSVKVKVKKPEFYKNIKYSGTIQDMTTLGKKYKWKHDNNECTVFIERVNKLLEDSDYTCPTCGEVL